MKPCNIPEVTLTLSDMVAATKGVTTMSAKNLKQRVNRVWNDSRKVSTGDVFVALTTDRDDGHRYVSTAFAQGASAALVNMSHLKTLGVAEQKKCIGVKDPLKALGIIATDYRKRMANLIVGVTGSNGKTTTRSFLAGVLGSYFKIGETYTNWNNDIGVPLSFMRFDGDEVCGIIEMGANHVGEIAGLSKIAQPDIAIITNIGYSHVGLFGGLTNTTLAKFEIAAGLDKKRGFLLLNGDDSRLVKHATLHNLKAVYFGESKRCALRATDISIDADGSTRFSVNGFEYTLAMTGRHFVYCALPAIFLAARVGVSEVEIAKALKQLKPVAMRGTIVSKKKMRFILDCYNANPSSMDHALRLLRDCASQQRVAIVGDMLELGTYASRLHVRLGKKCAQQDLRILIAVGAFAGVVAEAAASAGMPKTAVFIAPDAESAAGIARKVLRAGDTVLVKGSRGIHLETVFEKL